MNSPVTSDAITHRQIFEKLILMTGLMYQFGLSQLHEHLPFITVPLIFGATEGRLNNMELLRRI